MSSSSAAGAGHAAIGQGGVLALASGRGGLPRGRHAPGVVHQRAGLLRLDAAALPAPGALPELLLIWRGCSCCFMTDGAYW